MIHKYLSWRVTLYCPLKWGYPFFAKKIPCDGLEGKMLLKTFTTLSSACNNLGHERQLVQKHLQMQVVNALHLGDKDTASNLLLNFQGGDFVDILEYCARAPDPLFALETWRIMNENSVHLKTKYWSFVVQALCRGGYLKEALKKLSFLEENDFMHPGLPLYNIFLNGCVRSQSLANANKCLKLMDERFVGKSEITYWELLKVAVWQGNLSDVYELWTDLRNYYNPSILSLRKFIWSFTKLGDVQAAYFLLQHMISMAGNGADCLRVSSEKRIRSSRLDIPIPPVLDYQKRRVGATHEAYMNDDKHAEEGRGHIVMTGLSISGQDEMAEIMRFDAKRNALTPEMRSVLRWSFNDLIHAFAQCRDYNMIEKLFLQMDELGLEPSPHTFDGFVRAVISEKGVAHAMRVVNEMGKRNLTPSNNTMSALSVAYSEILMLDIAESLLDQIHDSSAKYIHPFNAFLSACYVADEPERAISILGKMKLLNMRPNIRTYELLFQLFGNVNAPYEEGNHLSHTEVKQRVDILEADMIGHGIQHSFVSLEILIRAFGGEGMITEMLQYFHLAQTLFLHPKSYSRTAMYNNVLHSLVHAKEGHVAVEIFREMKDGGNSPPDSATYNIMIDCCSLLGCFKSACALLSLMLRSGFNPQAVTYTALIKILLSKGDFDSTIHLLEQSTSEGVELDVVFFNTVLLEADRKGRVDLMEMILERMNQAKIRPDPGTCRHAFSAYARRGFHSSAMEALQVLSLRMLSEEDRALLRERRPFFDELVHGEDPDVDSRIVNVFEEVNEHLAVALLNLRWCAISGHPVSWEPEESSWVRRLASS